MDVESASQVAPKSARYRACIIADAVRSGPVPGVRPTRSRRTR